MTGVEDVTFDPDPKAAAIEIELAGVRAIETTAPAEPLLRTVKLSDLDEQERALVVALLVAQATRKAADR